MLNTVSMIYEVNPDFDLEMWKASVGLETMAAQEKLDAKAVADVAGPLPVSRTDLVQSIMEEWNVAKNRAYVVIKQAVAAGTLEQVGRKQYRATYEAPPAPSPTPSAKAAA